MYGSALENGLSLPFCGTSILSNTLPLQKGNT